LNIVKSSAADETLRTIGIWFLTQLPWGKSLIADFLILLRDQSPSVRCASTESMGKLGIRESVPLLIQSLRDDPALEVKKMAAYSLGLIGDPRALEPLCAIAADPKEPEHLRGMAAEALGNLGNVDAAPTLCKVAQDPSQEVKYWATYALGELPLSAKESVPIRALLEQLAACPTSTERVREQALDSLSRLRER
jgi:HEAT repeat protein